MRQNKYTCTSLLKKCNNSQKQEQLIIISTVHETVVQYTKMYTHTIEFVLIQTNPDMNIILLGRQLAYI